MTNERPNYRHGHYGTPTYTKWRNLRSTKTRGQGTKVTRLWTSQDGHGFGRFLTDVGPRPGIGWQLRRLVGMNTFCKSYAFWRPYHEKSHGLMHGMTDPSDWALDDWPYQLCLDRDEKPLVPSAERRKRPDRDRLIYRWPMHPNGLWWQTGDMEMFDDEADLADLTQTIYRELAEAQGIMED